MVSVIIPVYNTEKYLKRCIDSVLDSVYKDFELILVNDGSEDKSLEICRMYCEKDCRIQTVDQEHKGVSAARNKGIEKSQGEWIIFVDSDDFISKDFLGMVVQESARCADLLIFDFQRLKSRTDRAAGSRNIDDRRAFEYTIEDRLYLAGSLLDGTQLAGGNMSMLSPCAKAYKRSVIEQHSIRFPLDLVIGEDRVFNMEYLLKMQSCVYIRKKVYFVELRPESAMHGFHPDFLQNDIRYQDQLKGILRRQGVFHLVEKPYYNSVLSCMADVLIRGIFHPGSTGSRQERYRLCGTMRRYRIYRQALKYNWKTGVLPRKVLLFFFRMECYGITGMLAKASYRVLEQAEEL